jgi:hypothetical protein
MFKFKTLVALFMSALMSQVPSTALAGNMIPTSSVVAELSRAELQNDIESYLQEDQVRSELAKNGVSSEEISSRLASLSELELRQLAGQVQEARAGGDILMTILIVVLIIFLIKRI